VKTVHGAKLFSSRGTYPGDVYSVPVSIIANPLCGLFIPVRVSNVVHREDCGVQVAETMLRLDGAKDKKAEETLVPGNDSGGRG
jgi:hypothetical protein